MKKIQISTHTSPVARSPIRAVSIFAAVAFAMPLVSAPAPAQLSKGNGDLRVMTYNVDEGTDFIEVSTARSLSQFLIAVGQTITQVRATNPPARMQALAKQIAAAAPALVSLQEVDQWYSGPFDPVTQTCGPTSLEFDMQQELLNALGPSYQVAYQALQYHFLPTPGLILLTDTFLCVQLFNYNVILARTDLSSSEFGWDNPQSGQYINKVFLTTPSRQQLPLPRSWVTVDATFHGKPFRFIGTHLESADSNIRRLQAAELRAGPANTSLPVIIAMDANAQAAPQPQDPTYLDFIAAGYGDAWSQIFPTSGFTCCQAQLVNNPVSQLFQRTDLILTLGGVEAQNIALFGATPTSKTAGGLWPSDHAGVAAQMVIEQTE
jgi:endonuclease/exonuclease/phosphatase family metal-dependent hydrolase